MKMLLGVAAYPNEPGVFPATLASIEALDRGEHVVEVRHYDGDTDASPEDSLTTKHNQMRSDVVVGGFDALLTIEADMIVPPDALLKLASVEADIAYALYCSRHNGMWLCFEQINGYKAAALNANPVRASEVWGQVTESQGAGFGCTLIHRRVLEAIEFRRDKRQKFADDWSFALDAKERGFTQKHHLGVVCGHIVHGVGVMWPDLNARVFNPNLSERCVEIFEVAVDAGGYKLIVNNFELFDPVEAVIDLR